MRCKTCNKKLTGKYQKEYCSVICGTKAAKFGCKLAQEKREIEYNKNPKKCESCKSILSYQKRGNRFCDRSCSASFNNKKRIENGWKLSEESIKKLRQHEPWNKGKRISEIIGEEKAKNITEKGVRKRKEKNEKYWKEANFEDLGEQPKRKRVLWEQDYKCNRCGLDEWMGEKLTLEFEHKDGNNQNNSRENVEFLCPNCHSLTPTWRGRNMAIRNKQNSVSDEEFLIALNKNATIRQALLELGLVPKGGNYKRAKKLLGLDR